MSYRHFLWVLAALIVLTGCEKAMQNMYEQPKYKPLTPSPLWSDGRSSRPLEPGVLAHSSGVLAASSSGRLSQQPLTTSPQGASLSDGREARENPPAAQPTFEAASPQSLPITMDALRRGRNRFDIFCAPCHSVTGDGDGIVVRRGFPKPMSLHTAQLREASDVRLFDAITYGYGVMYPFEDRITAADRWAIVAYIRALQLSQNARFDELSSAERNALSGQIK